MARTDVPPHRILVVDDNLSNAQLLQLVLAAEGHQVAIASDGAEALARVADYNPDLIMLDLDMPEVDGFEVCRRVKQNVATRLIPIVIVTAQSAFEAKLHAWELGADDFITKPFQCVEVVARCRSLLRIKSLVDERDSAEAVVFCFARVVEAKNPYTQGHSERVAAYAVALAGEVGIEEDEREVLRKGALLHDIGKISVPDAILDKPEPLTVAEFEVMKQHTVQGARMVEPLRSVRHVISLIRWHHERLDGHGYPDGLRGDEIPHMVRILSVADVYDSLASDRPYRDAIPHAQCLKILRGNSVGGGLDADLVESFCNQIGPRLETATRDPMSIANLLSLLGAAPPSPSNGKENHVGAEEKNGVSGPTTTDRPGEVPRIDGGAGRTTSNGSNGKASAGEEVSRYGGS